MSRYSLGSTPFHLPQFRWNNIDKPFERHSQTVAAVTDPVEPPAPEPPTPDGETSSATPPAANTESSTANPEEVGL